MEVSAEQVAPVRKSFRTDENKYWNQEKVSLF